MENHVKEIFAVPVGEQFLVYCPLQQISAVINKAALKELALYIKGNMETKDLSEQVSGFFETIRTAEVVKRPENKGPLHPLFLGIIPTRGCNMSCRYCDFLTNESDNRKMDYALAVSAVDWMARHMHSLGATSLEIHFFGGEPFVAGDVLDVVVHRARSVSKDYGLTPWFEVSTNGLFDERRARFIADYFNAVVLSFDGFKKEHDAHRPVNNSRGSFDQVAETARYLSRSPVELCFRSCISQYNVNNMANIAQWFVEEFQPSVINFETVSENERSMTSGIYPPDPYEFSKNFINACRALSGYGVRIIYASTEIGAIRDSFCPVGKDTLMVSPDGRVRSCYLPGPIWKEKGMDLDVGFLKANGGMDINMDAINRLRNLVKDKPLCNNCFCRWTCAGGCHVRNSYPGCDLSYNAFCIQTRLITACLLLEGLGQRELADDLLQDDSRMQQLSLNSSDRL